MKKIILALSFILSMYGVNAQEKLTFGDVKVDESIAKEASSVIEALKNTKEVEDITITGKVKAVCLAKGCWMTIELPNGEDMTMKFKDYAFFMPMDCAGKTIVAHGKAFIKETSVAELRHLAEDAGKTKKQIKKIKKPKVETRFEADGVTLMS